MKIYLKIICLLLFFVSTTNVNSQNLGDARKLVANEQYEKARSVFKVLVTKNPMDGDNFFYFGDLMLKMENLDSAKFLFQRGIDINPTNALTHVGLARYYLYTGNGADGQKAIAYAKSVVKTQEGKKGMNMEKERQVQIYLEIAVTETWGAITNYDDAINLTIESEKLSPSNPEVFLIRGDALYKKDPVNGTPAITNYNVAAKLDPKSCRANVRIGQVYMNGKNMASAIGFYNVAIKTDSSFAPAWRLKGEAQYQIQRFDSAQKSMANYLRLNDDATSRYRYCVFLYKSGNHSEAIAQGKISLAKDNSTTVIYRIIARCYLEEKTPEPLLAIEYFNLFFIEQKKSGAPAIIADDFIGRGKAFSKNSQDSIAIVDYNNALAIDTARKDIYFDIATSYYKMKKYDRAAVYYKKKIDLNPAIASVYDWSAYGKALFYQKDYSNADISFKKITLIDSTNLLGWYWRGRVNQASDPEIKFDSTRIFYETYFELAIKDKEKNKKDLLVATKYLAGYHQFRRNFACSKSYFLFALELDPANVEIKKQLDTDKDIKAATEADINTCRGIKAGGK